MTSFADIPYLPIYNHDSKPLYFFKGADPNVTHFYYTGGTSYFQAVFNQGSSNNQLIVLAVGKDAFIDETTKYCLDIGITVLSQASKISIQVGDIKSGFKLNDLKKYISDYAQFADKVTVMSNIHSDIVSDNLVLGINEEDRVDIKDYFRTLNDAASGKVVDVALFSCYGAKAVDSVGILPIDSRVAIFSGENDELMKPELCHSTVSKYCSNLVNLDIADLVNIAESFNNAAISPILHANRMEEGPVCLSLKGPYKSSSYFTDDMICFDGSYYNKTAGPGGGGGCGYSLSHIGEVPDPEIIS